MSRVGWFDGFDAVRVSERTRAVAEALFVTVLWSSSYVLITIGLADIPALTFAGLRYALASLVLLPLFVSRGEHRHLSRLSGTEWASLLSLGVLLYAVTQGAQFVGLLYLPSATVSLLLTFTPALVALVALPTLGEWPSPRQRAGIGLLSVGAVTYFLPLSFLAARVVGLGVMLVALVGNALSSVLGRRLNRTRTLSPLLVTTVSMTVGSAVLLGGGVAAQGLPPLTPRHWAIVGWLAVVNTAGAFTLWNRTLRTLSAVESSVINNTMLAQVALLGWVFLGESLTALDVVGLALVGGGALFVQVGGRT